MGVPNFAPPIALMTPLLAICLVAGCTNGKSAPMTTPDPRADGAMTIYRLDGEEVLEVVDTHRPDRWVSPISLHRQVPSMFQPPSIGPAPGPGIAGIVGTTTDQR